MMTQEGEQIFVNFAGVETTVGRNRALIIHIRLRTMDGEKTFSWLS